MIRKRMAAFVDAGRGVITLMKTQVHAWVHLVATVGVIASGLWFQVTASEWCMLVLSMGLVWSAEAVNTAIEFVVDLVSPEHHDLAGKAKDTAAGAVLLASIAAAAVGVIVFGPHLLRLLTGEQ